jgi:hypothetical protein
VSSGRFSKSVARSLSLAPSPKSSHPAGFLGILG